MCLIEIQKVKKKKNDATEQLAELNAKLASVQDKVSLHENNQKLSTEIASLKQRVFEQGAAMREWNIKIETLNSQKGDLLKSIDKLSFRQVTSSKDLELHLRKNQQAKLRLAALRKEQQEVTALEKVVETTASEKTAVCHHVAEILRRVVEIGVCDGSTGPEN